MVPVVMRSSLAGLALRWLVNASALPFVGAALALAACVAPPAPAPAPADVELVVLGIAQDGGLPHFGCEQPCCTEARRTGRVLYPSALGVVDRRGGTPKLLLVEATPRIEEQVALLHDTAGVHGRGRQPVDAVLTTHAHLGHYLGLAWFGREVAGSRAIPLHASPRFCAFVEAQAPWKQLVALQQIAPRPFAVGEPFAPWPGLTITAVQVPHRDEFSDTMAFVLRGPNRAVLFVPDVDAWEKSPGLLDRLLDGVDVAYLDGTFYDGRELPDRNLAEIPHPLMARTMELLGERARRRPGTLRFLHMNHSNPVLHDAALRARIEMSGFGVAAQGERVAL
ncbi:MAG: MBL fold metallo-hydrolase [Planctomycetes bacterium]|nr:MBL fold metallo-hydrolase [Planctomycetota bacterium]